ncbi:MAG: HAMP domain-containing histidine kinase [Rubellimicrobium sp.]|nr:HAMP domain-containing histidine kinase [Rubellimicrobium sp.]
MWALAAGVTANRLQGRMDRVFDAALEETGQRLLPMAVRDIVNRDADDTPDQGVATLRDHDEYLTWIVRDAAGAVLLRSHRADPSVFPPYSGIGLADTATHRIYSDSALRGSLTIAVAEPLAHRRAMAWEALRGLALPLAILLPFSVLAIWAALRIALRPLDGFRRAIAARGAGDLSPVATDGLPVEFRPNAAAVNHLLDRLRQTLEAERSFTANAAHELRTPVAAALAQVQRLVLETGEGNTRARGQQIETALRRLARLSEKLLHLARAEGGGLSAGGPADLGPILRMVIRDFGGARIAAAMPDRPVMVAIDPDAFAILARNLIENALIHGGTDEAVVLELAPDGTFSVTNTGPVVPAEVLARLARPFARGESKADGAGIGLAIARTIAISAGGNLILTSPRPGRADGFSARFVPPLP